MQDIVFNELRLFGDSCKENTRRHMCPMRRASPYLQQQLQGTSSWQDPPLYELREVRAVVVSLCLYQRIISFG